MESERICPNCGYQIKADEYYCPSCRHRVEETRTVPLEMALDEPVAEKVGLARALVFSSFIYLSSVTVSATQFIYLLLLSNPNQTIISVATLLSTGLTAVASIWLASGAYRSSRKIAGLHLPSILTFLFGCSNIVLLIALVTIFPSSGTLNEILTQITSLTLPQQLIQKYSSFFLLAGMAGLLGIPGVIGVVVAILRSSRILSQPLIRYGIFAGIILTFVDAFTGIPFLIIIAPVMIFIGTRRMVAAGS